ncbi:Klhdc8b, partial [Symbiodinium necroappetens]
MICKSRSDRFRVEFDPKICWGVVTEDGDIAADAVLTSLPQLGVAQEEGISFSTTLAQRSAQRKIRCPVRPECNGRGPHSSMSIAGTSMYVLGVPAESLEGTAEIHRIDFHSLEWSRCASLQSLPDREVGDAVLLAASAHGRLYLMYDDEPVLYSIPLPKSDAAGSSGRSCDTGGSDAVQWTALSCRQHVTRGFATAAVSRRIYACGGIVDADGEYDDQSTPVREAECFDVVTGTWYPIPPMLTARWGGTAAGVGGKLLICGGTECPEFEITSGRYYFLDTVEVLNLASGTWCRLPPLLKPRMRPVVVMGGAAGDVLIMGGTGLRLDEDAESHAWGGPDSEEECITIPEEERSTPEALHDCEYWRPGTAPYGRAFRAKVGGSGDSDLRGKGEGGIWDFRKTLLTKSASATLTRSVDSKASPTANTKAATLEKPATKTVRVGGKAMSTAEIEAQRIEEKRKQARFLAERNARRMNRLTDAPKEQTQKEQ